MQLVEYRETYISELIRCYSLIEFAYISFVCLGDKIQIDYWNLSSHQGEKASDTKKDT